MRGSTPDSPQSDRPDAATDRLRVARARLETALSALERAAERPPEEAGESPAVVEAARADALEHSLNTLRGEFRDLQATARSASVRLDHAVERIDALLRA